VTFTVANVGSADAGAFDVDIVWSDDGTIGNGGDGADDELVVATVSVSSLAAGATTTRTVPVDLDRVELYSRAVRDDPPGLGVGYVCSELDTLGIVIDPASAIAETNRTNNFDQGDGVDKDTITYFPWDTDGNGQVAPTDAMYVINRIRGSDPIADQDGNGQVSPTDAIAVINRVGYLVNAAAKSTALDTSHPLFGTVSADVVAGSPTAAGDEGPAARGPQRQGEGQRASETRAAPHGAAVAAVFDRLGRDELRRSMRGASDGSASDDGRDELLSCPDELIEELAAALAAGWC
jgi:hypothetical protein